MKKYVLSGAAVTAVITAAALALPAAQAGAQTPSIQACRTAAHCPWLNTHQSVARRVAEVMSHMTTPDKITMVEGQGTSRPYVFYMAAQAQCQGGATVTVTR